MVEKGGLKFDPTGEEAERTPRDSAKRPGAFTRAGFWRKLKILPRSAGRQVLELALLLYLLLRDPDVPLWAKASIAGTLGYFICPLDLMPDLLPGVGYADDVAAMLSLIKALSTFITERHRDEARRLCDRWLREH